MEHCDADYVRLETSGKTPAHASPAEGREQTEQIEVHFPSPSPVSGSPSPPLPQFNGSGARESHLDAANKLNDHIISNTDAAAGGSLPLECMTKKPSPSPHAQLTRLNTQRSMEVFELASNEMTLKANLYFHISNPLKRWKIERRVPIKLLLQLIKTAVFITQIVLISTISLSNQRSDFFYESRELFASLFVKDFDREGPRNIQRIYVIQDVYDELEFLTKNFYQLPSITLVGYDRFPERNSPLNRVRVDLYEYKLAEFSPSTSTYRLDAEIERKTIFLEDGENVTAQFIRQSNNSLLTHRLASMEVLLPLKNIRVDDYGVVECFAFNITIVFKDVQNSGILNYILHIDPKIIRCNGTDLSSHQKRHQIVQGFLTVVDVTVMLLCLFSLFLTFMTFRRALKLGKAMAMFYEKHLGIPLTWWERRPLFSTWHVFNIVSDVLIIAGSLAKIMLDYRVNNTLDASPSRTLLGTAFLFQAGVILRYISYFKQLNALTRTLTMAFPELLKFLLCTFILLTAFAFTGWLVLGSYHTKFGNLNVSFETLFGLLNGDDIFETFKSISIIDDPVAYIYSRFYFYIFLSLFIYAVLNIFTSLVITAYDNSKNVDTATKNEIRRFVFSGPLTQSGVALRDITLTKKWVDPELVKNRKKREEMIADEDDDNEIMDG